MALQRPEPGLPTGSSLSRRPRAVVTVRTCFFTLCMDVPPYLCPVPSAQELAHSQVLATCIILPQRRHELAAVKYRAFREAMTLQNLASCGERCPGESAGEARSCCVLAFDNPECGPTVSYAEPSWVGKEKQELRHASLASMGGRGSLAPLVSALKQRGGFTTWAPLQLPQLRVSSTSQGRQPRPQCGTPGHVDLAKVTA